jgi:hypothetical protein
VSQQKANSNKETRNFLSLTSPPAQTSIVAITIHKTADFYVVCFPSSSLSKVNGRWELAQSSRNENETCECVISTKTRERSSLVLLNLAGDDLASGRRRICFVELLDKLGAVMK